MEPKRTANPEVGSSGLARALAPPCPPLAHPAWPLCLQGAQARLRGLRGPRILRLPGEDALISSADARQTSCLRIGFARDRMQATVVVGLAHVNHQGLVLLPEVVRSVDVDGQIRVDPSVLDQGIQQLLAFGS